MPPTPSGLRSRSLVNSLTHPSFSPLRSCSRRYTTKISELCPLPPKDEWRTAFASLATAIRERVSIRNPKTATRVAHSFLSGKSIVAGEGKIVIEAFPGPGALSRALLELDEKHIKKLIILEDWEKYLQYLKPLEADPRVTVVPLSGFHWDTYSQLEDRGLLKDVETIPWDGGVHPQLHFISHIPHTIKGEQLIAQFFRCIPERSWLFKYGRVPMSLVLGEWIWERATAPHGSQSRCKVSVIAEASALRQNSVPPISLLPYDEHFHPMTSKSVFQEKRPESRRAGHPYVSVNILPYEEQVISPGMMDKWDFVLRRLFVLKSTPLKKAINSLAPGASSILKMLTDTTLPQDQRVDITTPIRKLTIADWALIIRAFDNWPFAPEDLMIHDSFSMLDERGR